MFKGFYNLTSGMLTHGKRLDLVANNMANVTTVGFKTDRFTTSTFEEVMWQRVGNRSKNYEELGQESWITAPGQMYTDYTQGSFDETNLPLDYAIDGNGFFAVETDNGRIYTRNGSFSLDDDGYLTLPGQGRVLSPGGELIQVVTDKLDVNDVGQLYREDGAYLGWIGVFQFEDPDTQLRKNNEGMFVSEDTPVQARDVRVRGGAVERSNVDWVREMQEMMSAQRAYQSAAEVLKIYDEAINRAATEVGRLS